MPHHSRPEPVTDDRPEPRAFRQVQRWVQVAYAAAGWGLVGAVAAGGGWAAGLALARLLLGIAVLPALLGVPLTAAALFMAGLGAAWGLLAGSLVGFLQGRPVARYGGGTAAIGAIGGGLSPVLAVAGGNLFCAELSSALGWAAAGLLAGVVGFASAHRAEPPETEDDASGGQCKRRERRRPAPHLVAILEIAGACLVGAAVTAPSDAGWAVLAVGLLGLAVAWAMSNQERRLEGLESRLREREERGG